MPSPPKPTVERPPTVAQVIGPTSGFSDPDPEFREFSAKEAKLYQFIGPGEQLTAETAKRHSALKALHKEWGNKLRRLAWDKVGPTVTCLVDRALGRVPLVHPDEPRCLSVGECRQLQGFPEDWVLIGDRWSRYRQVGNAVPPEMIYQAVRSYWRP
jgi:DNA (cytosine-5)-methyltransferase 1